MSGQTTLEPSTVPQLGTWRSRGSAGLVIALGLGLLVWLAVRDNGSQSSSATSTEATAVSVSQLVSLASSLGRPIFWAGSKRGHTYELTRKADGSVFLRYLPPGAMTGATEPYLTVPTYPFPGTFKALRAVAAEGDSTAIALPGKGVAAISSQAPTSAHIAYPGVDYQVEVFDPSPAAVRKLVTSGQVTRIG